MARLIRSTEFDNKLDEGRLDPSWYFIDAYYEWVTRDEGRWHFSIERTYPFSAYIHRDVLLTSNHRGLKADHTGAQRRIEINRWIAATLHHDVILSYFDRSYRFRRRTTDGSINQGIYGEQLTIPHGYHRFSFVMESEMIHFRLNFAQWITTDSNVSDRHPDYGHIDEEQIYPA